MKRLDLYQALAVILSISCVTWFYAPFLLQRWAISPHGDTLYLTGPLFCEISRTVKAGASPLFNWSTFEALDYNPNVAPYHPLYFFGWLRFCSAEAAAQAVDIIAVIHIAIFMVTMTSLIRATGAGIRAGIIGAGMCVAIPNTFELAVFPTFVTAAAWLPMAIEGLVRIFYRKERGVGALLLALGTGAMLSAGPGSNFLSTLALIGLIMSVDRLVVMIRRRDSGEAGRLGAALLIAGALTALLTLASTLYLFSHLGEIIRWTRSGPVIGSSGLANPAEILVEQRGWRDLMELLLPVQVTYAAGYFLLGPVAVLLALVGAVRGWPHASVRIFAVICLVCVVLVFLSPSYVLILWSFIPGLSHTRHLSLIATPLSLAVAILSAHGFEAIIQGGDRRPARARLYVVAGIAVLALCAGFAFSLSLRSSYPAWELALLASLAAIVFIFTACQGKAGPRAAAVVLLVGVHFAFLAGSLSRPDGAPVAAKSETWRSIAVALERIRTSDPDPGRVALHMSVKEGDLTFMSAGSIPSYMDFTTFSHYSTPRIYWKFVHEIAIAVENKFAPFGGKYLLSSEDLDPSIGEEVFREGSIRVYLLKGHRPLVAMVCLPPQQLEQVFGSATKKLAGQLRLLLGPGSDVIATAQDGQRDCSTAQEQAAPQINRAENALEFAVSAGEARLAVINMPPYAAWHMQIGGQKIALHNLQQRQVVAVIPAGVSGKAMLVYQPRLYSWLKLISGVAWLGAIVALIGLLVRRRVYRNRSVAPAPI